MKQYALLASLYTFSLCAQPADPAVVQGKAEFASFGRQLDITVADKSIIHWNDFSIDLEEIARFVLPHAEASVLNRVVGGNPSQILGQLESNGRVFLINPNGILVGEQAYINVAAFFASTFDVLDADFFKGKELVFSGASTKEIVNRGVIQTLNGDAVLIARRIENHGTVDVQGGKAAFLAQDDVVVKPQGFDRLYIRPHDGFDPSSQDGFSGAFVHGAEPDALDFDPAGMITHTGRTSSQNADGSGGSIIFLADQITLDKNSSVDASGLNTGGEVIIGGDFQGKNSDYPSAQSIYVGRDALISADGSEVGGKVILWADEKTGYFGTITAQGNSQGGLVEVSGCDLTFQGAVSTRAASGKDGVLYLDPNDIIIDTNLTDPPPPTTFYSGIAGTSRLNNVDLGNALDANSVVVTTNLQTGGTGTITVSDPVMWTNPNHTLTLDANSDIFVNTAINSSGNDSGIILQSASGNISVASTATQQADIFLSGQFSGTSVQMLAPNGVVFITSQPDQRANVRSENLAGSGGFIIQAQALRMTSNGSLVPIDSHTQISTANGDITINVAQDVTLISSIGVSPNHANTILEAGIASSGTAGGGNLTIRAATILLDATNVTAATVGGIALLCADGTGGKGLVDITTTSDVTMLGGIGFQCAAVIFSQAGGNVQMDVGGNLTMVSGNTAGTVFSPAVILTSLTSGNSIDVSVTGNMTVTGGLGTGAGAFSFGGIDALGSVNLNVGGTLTLDSGNPTMSGTADARIHSIAGAVNVVAGQINMTGITNGGRAQITADAGIVDVASGGNINMNFARIAGSMDTLATAGVDLSVLNASELFSTAGNLNVVVDARFQRPAIGRGAFIIDGTGSLNAGSGFIGAYTARQGQNIIDPNAFFQGLPFSSFGLPSLIFVNTDREVWCIYFQEQLPFSPFTIFYKDCFQTVSQAANTVISEFLMDMHPYDEDLGWDQPFRLLNTGGANELYFLRHKKLQQIHQPKFSLDFL